jgi:hypothetical protein
MPSSPSSSRDGPDFGAIESKDPSELTDRERFALNGKPRLGDFQKCEVETFSWVWLKWELVYIQVSKTRLGKVMKG